MNLTMINSENMKKTKRKKSKTKINNYAGIEGVEKIVLPDDVQKLLMCEVGEQVSVQEPWAYVQKQTVMDNLLTTENSVFLPYKVELENYETDKILLGYIPDETDDIDEFYMCLTAESVIKTAAIAKKHRDEQRQKLQDIVCKTPGEWTSLGSDINTNKNNRALLEVLIETQYPIPKDKTKFRVHWAKAGDTSYTELLSTDNGDSILKKRIDNSVQVAPSHAHNEAQTVCTFPKNATANYQYNYDEIDPVLFQSKLDSYYVKHSLSFNNWLVINGLFNLYTLDYHVLAAKSILPPSRKKFHINEYMTYSDIQRCKGRMVEAVTWHPTMSWLFVVSYSTFSSYYYIRNEADDDEVFRAVHTLNPVLVWSVNDYLMPKLVLHSPREVMHLSFCPYDGNILIGEYKLF
ncbi:unnamed protein product [Brassicogethes aeneus]|uniref:Uncharacterized protein n=1 Tax=Brassicogethes aeneus TaxID=1431903 RepID=A0A9P0B5K4_BRAAE|nr:unnamed protein product [Brassicogethes aeneus]